jgi:hypothetical protein
MTVSRSLPTAIDEVIPSQDLLLLQFAFSDLFESSGGTIIGKFLKRLSVSFSPAIESKPLRHAIVAFAAAYVPAHLYPSFAERIEEQTALASKALRKKTSTNLDEGDLFAVCLLTLLSCIQGNAEKFRIHLGGLIAIMFNHFLASGSRRYLERRSVCFTLKSPDTHVLQRITTNNRATKLPGSHNIFLGTIWRRIGQRSVLYVR